MHNLENIAEKFKILGFTLLESDIYCYLLRHGLSTGYSIAKGINKPAANVYKALDTLSQKGGVVASQGASKSYNATHWKELLNSHQKQFEKGLDDLSDKLKLIEKQEADEQVYQVDNYAQVIDHTIDLIKSAKKVVLADIEPDAIPLFEPALVEAANRGVEVRIKAYEEVELVGVHVTLRRHGLDIYKKTTDVSFTICIDGNEFSTAMLAPNNLKVIQAFRSQSALMNSIVHNYVLYGQVLTELKAQLKDNDFEQAKMTLKNTEHLHPLSEENFVFYNLKQRYDI
ncbi:hypothetical protein CWB96_22535 [Pseudoalteromonas citrea]|uniref:Transcription regulator TrmB N-terminal domain-containing protein n=1 Tax=Pseudoalteromonas citrea TaxID=43655 RepID=A0A5S3XE13_9GAMM|nr:helix-turn-helix domain-containing protein [Pseudoalteromonas citrea]TMP38121.1 hypothetical protein CWB97_22300 [Pseudoalteromonas citrea]TMP51143.1 hypothetical protein CWB96_22535 [Pseudoalteromonas citrea]